MAYSCYIVSRRFLSGKPTKRLEMISSTHTKYPTRKSPIFFFAHHFFFDPRTIIQDRTLTISVQKIWHLLLGYYKNRVLHSFFLNFWFWFKKSGTYYWVTTRIESFIIFLKFLILIQKIWYLLLDHSVHESNP